MKKVHSKMLDVKLHLILPIVSGAVGMDCPTMGWEQSLRVSALRLCHWPRGAGEFYTPLHLKKEHKKVSHSYSRVYFHLVWSTKYRLPYYSKEAQKELFRYIHAIVRQEGVQLIAIGGVYDHIHILVRVKTNECIERLIRIIKVKTSKFIKQLKGGHECFFWQIGYSKFSVSPSLVKKTAQYINNQEEHHKNRKFEDEMKMLLEF